MANGFIRAISARSIPKAGCTIAPQEDMIVTPEGLNVHPEDVEAVLNAFRNRESVVVGPDHVTQH